MKTCGESFLSPNPQLLRFTLIWLKMLLNTRQQTGTFKTMLVKKAGIAKKLQFPENFLTDDLNFYLIKEASTKTPL